jgi:ankyrin repeat protein
MEPCAWHGVVSSMNIDIPATELPPLPPPERLQDLLFDASRLGRDDVIPALLAAGAGLEVRDARGYTALILASYSGHLSTTALLLASGAEVDAPDTSRGNTALMGAAFKGYKQIAKMLVEAGADVDCRNRADQTALMNAAMFGHDAIVDLLIARGADPCATDSGGNSPTSLASAQSNAEMVAKIEAAIRERHAEPIA